MTPVRPGLSTWVTSASISRTRIRIRHSRQRLAGASSLPLVDHGGDLHVAVGQRGRVEGAVGGREAAGSAADDAVEAGRASGAGGRPPDGPAGLQVPLAVKDDG